MQKIDERVAFLRQVPIFKDMLLKELAAIASRCRNRSYPRDALILSEGAPGGKGLFMIMKGMVNITQHGRGGEKPLAMLKEFDFFGEMSLLDRSAVSATLYAADDCEILVLDAQAFDQLVSEEPVVASQLLLVIGRVLTHRLRDLERKGLNVMEKERGD